MIKKDKIQASMDEIYSSLPRRKYTTNKTIFESIDDCWSSDL